MSTYSEMKDVLELELKHIKWETINDNYNECKGTVLKKKTVIESTLSVLVIQLNLYNFVNGASKKIIDNRINTVLTSTTTINKKKYKLMSAIFHKGEEMNRGHYTCMLRADKKSEWYYCNDLQVIKKKWLKGAEEAYIMFLEQINVVDHGGGRVYSTTWVHPDEMPDRRFLGVFNVVLRKC
ncbi:hypothetical protein ALC57_13246 [Trachymyrmex cornetzi]|uniref:USP domain-containing protein n=1 Tax=Trachymyrmex cornetzi TaxID=471704 RepID=A0A151IZM6_9HYME|nr:hypothetical protein ALC57_13246 [Trachymyrmex cornetzi]